MPFYLTRNPVPSTDMRDVFDNAQVLDSLLNGTDAEVTGRTGKELKSIAYLQSVLTSLDVGSLTFSDTIAGLAGTTSGQYFRVPDGGSGGFTYYANSNGSATQVAYLPGQAALDAISTLMGEDENPDNLLSLIDKEDNVVAIFSKDDDGELIIMTPDNLRSNNGFESDGFKIVSADGFAFLIEDKNGNVAFAITESGEVVGVAGSSTTTANVDYMQGNSALKIAGNNAFRRYILQFPVKKLNLYIYYGQSYSIGADSERVLSSVQIDGNVMLGNYSYGTSTNGTGDFAPDGGDVLKPLIANGKESPAVCFLNELKQMRNEKYCVDGDSLHLYGTAEAGVGSRSIAQMISGECWNRLTSCLSDYAAAAASAGYEVCVAGIIYMQGENDNTQTYDYYYGQLGVLFSNINTLVKQYFPSNKDVHFYLSGIGAYFASDATHQDIPRAQMDYCANNTHAHFIGPYQALPCQPSGIHLLANAYRWFGAQAAKVVNLVESGKEQTIFRMREATHQGADIFVGFDVPCPPIQFKSAYIKSQATLFIDRGFTVSDDKGTLVGSTLSISLHSDTVVKISCSRNLSGTVRVTLGDNANHTGRHNIADSDNSLSSYQWVTNTDTTAADYITELNGKNYPLNNWAGLDSILSEEM